MRTFNIIPDPTQKIYQEIIVLDGGPDFHPPTYKNTVARLTRSVPLRKQTESEFWKKVTKTFQKTVSFS